MTDFTSPMPEEVYRAVNVEVSGGRVQDDEGNWLATLLVLFHGRWNLDVDTNAHVYAYLPRDVAESLRDQLDFVLSHFDAIEEEVARRDTD